MYGHDISQRQEMSKQNILLAKRIDALAIVQKTLNVIHLHLI